ncbi:MAG TPA: transporter substrate-binding domain-containing protein [Candidatus Binatia bacterium]|nr:transporter substrate-binding domain-containing protein [Candidatus Binatia bacterium]
MWRFLFGLLFLFSLSGRVRASEPTEFRVCLLEDNLPYSSHQNNSGFDLDTAQAVAEALQRTPVPIWVKNNTHIDEIEDSDFPTRRLSRNECDALFSVPGPDAVKDSPKLTVGAPYYGAAFELIGRASGAPTTLAALGENPVAVQSQTIANFVLNARKAKMRTFFSTEEALNDVAKGETVTALLWGPTAGWYLRNHPELKLFFVAGYEPPAVVCWNEHVATRKSDSALREAIDKALAQLNASGALQQRLEHYGIPFHRPFDTTYSLAEMQKLR